MIDAGMTLQQLIRDTVERMKTIEPSIRGAICPKWMPLEDRPAFPWYMSAVEPATPVALPMMACRSNWHQSAVT
jgi:hypothetical protein